MKNSRTLFPARGNRNLVRGCAVMAATVFFSFPQPAHSNFTLVDDFEAYPLGAVRDDPASPWTAHGNTNLYTIVDEDGNRFLGYGWFNGLRGGSRPLPAEMQIAPGGKATFFLQFRAGPFTAGSEDEAAFFGLTHNVNTGSHAPEGDFRVATRLRPGPSAVEHSLEVRDGAAWRSLTTIAAGSWHNLWYVIDRTDGDTFRLYLTARGDDASGADLLGYQQNGTTVHDFAFRDGGSPGDVIDGVAAYGQAPQDVLTRSIHLDNLWMDPTGENLTFAGDDFNAWHEAYQPLDAPFDLRFGQGAGDDGDEGLLRSRPANYPLQSSAIRYTPVSETFISSAAAAVVENYLNRQDFSLEAEMTLWQLPGPGANRAGFFVLGDGHQLPDAPFNALNDDGFYGLVWHPAVGSDSSLIQIRDGFQGPVLVEAVWEGLHPSEANFGMGGIGNRYKLTAEGTYDAEGGLELSFTLSDNVEAGAGHSQTVSAYILEPHQGNLFGFGGRTARDPFEDPQFDFHTLSMTVGDEPVEIEDPFITWPFNLAFGSGENRDRGDLFLANRQDEWTLEAESLRLAPGEADFHPSLRTSRVLNYEGGSDFVLRLRASLAGHDPAPSDTRVGLVLFGDADRDVFDPDDDETYYTFHWSPNAPSGPSIAVRRGMNGPVVARTDFAGLSNPPVMKSGGIYEFEFHIHHQPDGSLAFAADIMDDAGGWARVLGEIADAPSGNRFGFGARHREAENLVWDFHELEMRDPAGIALYTDNDRVTGAAHVETRLGYFTNGGNGLIGTEGGATDRRHHNPVLGFELPDVPFANIVRFELALSRASGRTDRDADLYGLIPVDPSIYNDGAVSPDPDGLDVWWDGPALDNRPGLVGASWPDFIPAGSPSDAVYTQDVTDFITSFYNPDGPAQGKVFFRLSPSVETPLETLARNTIQTGKERQDSPVLKYFIFPPLEPFAPDIAPTFDGWRMENFSQEELDDPEISGPAATPAGDLLPNLLKYAFGIAPFTPATLSDAIGQAVVDGKLRLTYFERAGAQDIEYLPELSMDLIEWNDGPQYVEEVERVSIDEGRFDVVTVQAVLEEDVPKKFLRVGIIQK